MVFSIWVLVINRSNEKNKCIFKIPTRILIFIFLNTFFSRYVIKEHSDSLTSIQRSLIVWAILNRTRYEDKSPEKVGIQRLVNKNVYKSAYPLHDGDYDYHDSEENSIKMNERRLLYLEWATIKNWYKKQPLWLIKNYFGVKIGLYFAWLGFYTKMLIIPSIVGIFSFIFGLSTAWSSWNQARFVYSISI